MLVDKVDNRLPILLAMTKVKHYFGLLKFRLSSTVAFSSAIGYMLGEGHLELLNVLLIMLGGFLVTGSANIINQILEKDLDKLMKRTAQRPLPTGALTIAEAAIFCGLLGVVG